MGNLSNIKRAIQPSSASKVKSKGERLGWEAVSQYKALPIKQIIGNGNIVEPISTSKSSLILVP